MGGLEFSRDGGGSRRSPNRWREGAVAGWGAQIPVDALDQPLPLIFPSCLLPFLPPFLSFLPPFLPSSSSFLPSSLPPSLPSIQA